MIEGTMRPFSTFRRLSGLLTLVLIKGCAAPMKVVPFGSDMTPPRTTNERLSQASVVSGQGFQSGDVVKPIP